LPRPDKSGFAMTPVKQGFTGQAEKDGFPHARE